MPNSLVIVNTSPLLYLHQVGYLDLLKDLYKNLIVPSSVVEELNVGRQQGVDVPDITLIKWIQIKSVSSPSLIPIIVDLGKGEAEVIAIGLENSGSLLIIDDQLARRIANLFELKYTGTLGVLVKAKQLGYFSSVLPVIQSLQSKGMWISQKVMTDILQLAGESPTLF